MKVSVLVAGAGCAAVMILAESSIEAAINTRDPKLYRYSETTLLEKTVRTKQFVVQGKKDPTEHLTLFVSPTSKFFRAGTRVSLLDGKIGDEVSGSFIIAVDRKAIAIETTFTAAIPNPARQEKSAGKKNRQ